MNDATDNDRTALRRVRRLLWLFVVCLVLSGLTAFPLESETRWLADLAAGPGAPVTDRFPALLEWILRVRDGIAETNARYPFLAYGTDWLAFAHLVIAAAFVGPLKDPVRNVWVIRWAVLACAGIVPLALICGPLRGIPLYWRFIDMSFGVIGVVPLLMVLRALRPLVERAEAAARVVRLPEGPRPTDPAGPRPGTAPAAG
ncbi:hypothetical protein OG401_34380 [Kitasatospora purpeofusca]|uniref:hypothetical protein n=1 Tax=Kitasatospora purpeofusca TaxID=67352 RepID=UPI00224DBE5E|nr:hypothetical protein [Kitasatospora purpeofusca]MCX4689327.1 hypothetical protein [Kitasatospora purpeofusca]